VNSTFDFRKRKAKKASAKWVRRLGELPCKGLESCPQGLFQYFFALRTCTEGSITVKLVFGEKKQQKNDKFS
jgi:hypothetical protein